MKTIVRMGALVSLLMVASFAAAQHGGNHGASRHNSYGYGDRHRGHELRLGGVHIDLAPPGHSRRYDNRYYNDPYYGNPYYGGYSRYNDRYYQNGYYGNYGNYGGYGRHARNCRCHDCRH